MEKTKKNKGSSRWLLYSAPFLIIAQWVFAYLVLIPIIYNAGVSFIQWFTPGNFIEALKDSRNVMYPLLSIIVLRLYNWLTLGGLIASLFFIGRSFQNPAPVINRNGKLQGNEAYLLTLGILEEIRQIQDTETAAQAVQLLNERLRTESAFGEGADAVICCENEIAENLEKIRSALPDLRKAETLADANAHIEMLCQQTMAKLKIRIELKKR